MSKNGMMVILSAPSGAGKDTVFKEISRTRSDVCESISATTREPRAGETDGVNYYFLTQSEFEKKIENNEFLEYASYNNCYYGTPASTVLKLVEEGKICFFFFFFKGAQKIMKSYPEAVSIFLMPPDMETLEKRLKKRNTDSEEAIISRLKIAEEEIKSASEFDYIVINNELEKAVDEINEILSTELRKRNA